MKNSPTTKDGNGTEQPSSTQQKTKRRNYKKELDQAIQEREQLKDLLRRTAADFDNYRKRVQQEKIELYEQANAELIKKLLPVLDDLDRTTSAESEGAAQSPFLQAVTMIRSKFFKIMQDEGLQVMETKGKLFDPEKHDALLLMHDEKAQPNMIIDEHEKGYELKEKILRHAKVIVNRE
ncbi:MAG: nucleotide exchange factor GrpE [Calditrichaeota bacterium]|nr:MAG: nucleotide exchange factor GrpE [Calditrichota bacterium]